MREVSDEGMDSEAAAQATSEIDAAHLAEAPSGHAIQLPCGTLSQDRQPILSTTLAGMKLMGGSGVPEFNRTLLNTTVATIANQEPDALALYIAATSAALSSFKPQDEIEGMIAAQAVALHHTAMECFRRAMLPGQMAEVASKLRRDGANMARAMIDMLDALDRKRGRGPQQLVRVERVVVHEGGQAIVGNVKGSGAAAT